MYKRTLIIVLAVCAVFGTEGYGEESNETKNVDERKLKAYLPPLPATGEKWLPGLHYNVLMPVPTNSPDKVELMELSMYTTWAATPKFKSDLKSWIEKNSAQVTYVRVPSVAFGMPHARLQARIFFTFEELGRGDLQEKLDAWVQAPQHEPIYHNIWQPNEDKILRLTLEFAKGNAIDVVEFNRVYSSETVEQKIRIAEGMTGAFFVNGTPTFVINRRYSVNAHKLSWPDRPTQEEFDRLLDLIKYLVHSELDANRK